LSRPKNRHAESELATKTEYGPSGRKFCRKQDLFGLIGTRPLGIEPAFKLHRHEVSMKSVSALAALAITAVLAGPASAAVTNLVQNGDFSESSLTSGQIGYNTTVTDWAPAPDDNSYILLLTATSAVSGVTNQFGTNNFSLWSTSNGGLNTVTAPPGGGSFVGMDGDYPGYTAPLEQTINGLTVGEKYTVNFATAYGQQEGYTGATTQYWTVSLGSASQNTPTVDVASKGFSGWTDNSVTFTATGTSEVLSFLAVGNTPVPPFALLGDVSMTAGVPEPATWAMMIVGIAGIGGMARRRRAILAAA
jgi:hypothetical protein